MNQPPIFKSCSFKRCHHSTPPTYQGILRPSYPLGLVGIGVGKALDLTGLTTEKAMQVGTDLVGLTGSEGVTLSTACLEEIGTFLVIACEIGSAI